MRTTERAHVCPSVGMHADVEIHIGGDGPDLTMDFADVDSLDRLASVAADGARQLRDRAAANELGDRG